MKLVDAEIPRDNEDIEDIPRAPRPARRRVYTSLFFTLSVLVGTVGVIYWQFPNRQSEVLTVAIAAHLDTSDNDLENPTGAEVRAWTMGIFDEVVPLPEATDGLVPKSAATKVIFKRKLAIVRYSLNGEAVSLAFRRVREASPRVHRRREDGLYAVSWHCKKFNCIAVGPLASKESWTKRFGAP